MDPPPSLPPLPITITTTAAPITATSIHLNYPDSQESSPGSHKVEGYENDPLPPVPGAKLRLMCSYGGHIIPRPHDKSLCYVGGDTRLVVVDRHSSLSSFSTRLSHSLLNGRSFALKYQLPNEDLDSLVSLTTDEDLENMIEEYDRLISSSNRIRLFIFFNKPETTASMGSLLDDAKSETWFVDALNGSGLLPRGFSDTTMDCLLNLDNENDLEVQTDHDGNLNRKHVNVTIRNNVALAHDVQYSMPDSPVVDTTSSLGSSSSSPSMSNLPPIRVRVEEHGSQIMEEQFEQKSFASVVRVQDDHGGVYGPSGGLPPPVPVGLTSGGVSHGDDERSDIHGGSVGVNRLRKPPLPLQPVQHKASSAYNLPSPDSVASDSNIASTNSVSKQMYYQDQVAGPPRENRAPSLSSPNTNPDNLPPIPTPQIQDSTYNNMPPQLDPQHQQQYVHYIPHQATTPVTTPVPVSSYYHPIYPPPQQQLHHTIDQHYPVYHVMPVTQTQPYLSMHSNIADTSVAASSCLLPTYNKDTTPTVYSTNRTAAAPAVIVTPPPPSLVQIPGGQFQQQYVAAGAGYSQMQHPSQANYGTYNEYANKIPAPHDQVYYATTTNAQHQAPAPPPPQYQTMTPAAVAAFTDASKQLPIDTTTYAADQNITTNII